MNAFGTVYALVALEGARGDRPIDVRYSLVKFSSGLARTY
jgi:hypothetical protein